MTGRTRFGVAGPAFAGGHVDLAIPALELGRNRREAPARRAVSWRWLSGTVLTGIASTALMGAALLGAIDNPTRVAVTTVPQAAAAGVTDAPEGGKTDRFRPVAAPVTSRQLIQVSTVSHLNDREVIRLRPFMRIDAALTGSREHADEVPPFDPMKILGEAAEVAAATPGVADQIYGAEVDGEVAIKVTPFPFDAPAAATELPTPEAERLVQAAVPFVMDGAVQLAALPYFDPGQGASAAAAMDPFEALGVRIIPENVTLIPRGEMRGADLAPRIDERLADLGRDETLPALLERSEVGEADAEAVILAMGDLLELDKLDPGDRVRLAFAPSDADGGTPRPIRVSLYRDGVHQATVARTDGDLFIRADEPPPLPEAMAAADAIPAGGQMPNLYQALYMTALEQQVPQPLIGELVRIFSYDLDFQARTGYGDSIQVFHSLPDPADPASAIDDEEVLFAAITVGGVTKRFYRYQTADDGVIDYYDEEGRSAKKFLMRKPINEGRYSSGFGYRRHPILGYSKLHTGVDWAAPRGTPIMASGDGTVISAGWSSGYGRYTRVRHTNGYETAYAHQDRIAEGIVPGAHVRQGQIIGFVGSTGLSTGPHLHYEVRINDRLVDPLEIRLPRGRVLEGDMLADFTMERERIDTLLGQSDDPTQFAAAQR